MSFTITSSMFLSFLCGIWTTLWVFGFAWMVRRDEWAMSAYVTLLFFIATGVTLAIGNGGQPISP